MSDKYLNKTGVEYFWNKIKSYVSSAMPTALSQLSDDSTHRLVTDTQITAWNAASGGLTIDDTLDTTSTNPVENQAIATAIDALQARSCLARGTNTSQTSGTAVTQVTLTAIILDTYSGIYSISSGGIKVSQAGIYKVSGSVYITPNSSTTTMGCYIKVGSSFSAGTEVNGVLQYMGASGARAVQVVPKLVNISAGQIVFLASRCRGTAGTHDASHESTFLQVERVA